MENLLTKLQIADRICKQAHVHFEKAAQIEQQIHTLNAARKKAKTKWIAVGFGIWFVSGIVGAIFAAVPAIGLILQPLCLLGGLAASISFSRNGYSREMASINAEIHSIQNKAQKESAAAQQIFDDNYDALSFLPDDYWYPMATSYLIKAIASHRVESLGDALDRLDAQIHRWNVEEANANLVAQQQAQTAHLKSIRTSSKINAAANVTNTIFNIASRL